MKKGIKRENKRYTEFEDEYIYEKWGTISIKAIARKLNRSTTGIEARAYRLGLGGSTYTDDILTTGQVAKMLNIHQTTVINWIRTHGLKAELKKMNIKAVYRILFDDLIDFLKDNQDLWNSARVKEYEFGYEYEWLIQKRRKDREANSTRSNLEWTTLEERKAIELFSKGLSSTEVAPLLQRTVIAVKRKRAEFIKRGITTIEPSPKWSEFQKDFVIQNWGVKTIEEIAEVIEKPIHLIERFGWKNGLGSRHVVEEGYYTFIDLAEKLSVSRSTIARWTKNFGLKAIEQNKGNKKRLVIHKNDLEEFLMSDDKYTNYLNVLKEAI